MSKRIGALYRQLISHYAYTIVSIFGACVILSVVLLTQLRMSSSPDPALFLSSQERAAITPFQNTQMFNNTLLLLLETTTHTDISPAIRSEITTLLKQDPATVYVRGAQDFPPTHTSWRDPQKLFHLGPGKHLMFLTLQASTSAQDARDVIHRLTGLLEPIARAQHFSLQFLGLPALKAEMNSRFTQEIKRLTLPLTVLIIFIPLIFFGAWSYILIPALVGLLTLLMTGAICVMFDVSITPATLTLIPLLMCLSLLDSSFFIHRYKNILSNATEPVDRRQILFRTLADVWIPCGLTTLTTVIGFISLRLTSHTPFIQEYAAVAACGVFLAYLIQFVLIPVLLSLGWLAPRPYTHGLNRLDVLPLRLALWGRVHRYKVIAASIILCIICLIGARHLHVENKINRIFSQDNPIERAHALLERHLGYYLPISLRFYAGQETSLFRFLSYADAFEHFVANIPVVKTTLSPFHGMDLHLDQETQTSLAALKGSPAQQIEAINSRLGKLSWEEIAQSNGWVEVGSDHSIKSIHMMAWLKSGSQAELDTFERYMSTFQNTMMEEFRVDIGGEFYLSRMIDARLMAELESSMFLGIALIILLVGLTVLSLRIGGIFLFVNLLPLAVLFGLMGWLDQPFHIGLISLPCILFALSVDDTIHLLWSFRSTQDIEITYKHTAKVVVVTSLMLMVVFLGQVFSNFEINVQFGAWAALAIFVALIADVVVLPALLSILPTVPRQHKWPAN